MAQSAVNATLVTESQQEPSWRRMTREEYHRAADLGLFAPDERLELIRGHVIRKMSPQREAHATGTYLVGERLRLIFGTGFVVRIQLPLSLSEHSEPEPDVAVCRGVARDYLPRHPDTAVIVVEVADTTLKYDRTEKAELYARADIPEYWLLNLVDRVLEVHRAPTGSSPAAEPRYRSVSKYNEADSVACLAAPGSPVRVAELLP